MKKLLYLIMMPLAILLGSCDDDKADQTFNATYPVSGEWIVNEYYGDDPTPYGPYHLQIFNTANSTDSVWMSNVYGDGVFIKAMVNPDKTFVTDESPDLSEGYAYATITEGRIVDTDSIHFNIALYTWDEDDNIVLEAEFVTAGRRMTGLDGH